MSDIASPTTSEHTAVAYIPQPQQLNGLLRRVALGGVGVVTVDQVSKQWVHTASAGIAQPVTNHELALGVVGGPAWVLNLLMILTLVGFGIHLLGRVRRQQLSPYPAALLLGGAAGNLIDRALLGSVRDFLPIPWVIINLADIAIVVGMAAYLTSLWRSRTSAR
jgi:lipoprotein signal peptidase